MVPCVTERHKHSKSGQGMNSNSEPGLTGKRRLVVGVPAAVLLSYLMGLLASKAAIIWTGPQITFSKVGSDPTQATNQDRITPDVWITRGAAEGIYNARRETNFTHYVSPTN